MQMLSHTATVEKPTMEVRITKTVSAAMTLEANASKPPNILKAKALTGTPRLLSLANPAGIIPSWPKDHTMRPEAKSPVLAEDRIAVMITKLKISAA